MKLYNKPELTVEAFDIEEVITTSTTPNATVDNNVIRPGQQAAGMEFDIDVDGNEF